MAEEHYERRTDEIDDALTLDDVVIPYAPLEEISTNILTSKGLQYVHSDKNISADTEAVLRVTERRIIEKGSSMQFRFLLDEHSPEEVVNRFFLSNREIGMSHVAGLVMGNPKQSFAEFVAAYSEDRRIPFVFSVVILKDLLKVNKGVKYYTKRWDGSLQSRYWRPPEYEIIPIPAFKKLSKAGFQSNELVFDNYVLTALHSFADNRKAAAAFLGISRQTLTNRLIKIGYFNKDGSRRPDYKSYLLKAAHSRNLHMEYTNSVTTDDNIPQSIAPPPKKSKSAP